MQYTNLISLGFFCSPAIFFEEIHHRNASYPFDWILTPRFETVLDLMQNRFDGFLEEVNLYQSHEQPHLYKDVKNDIIFVHDFSPFVPLGKQLPDIRQKYARRINRFFSAITSPSLFIRYIASEEDLTYVCTHHHTVDRLLKTYHPDNKILYFANSDMQNASLPEGLEVRFVERDAGDTVARRFWEQDTDFFDYIINHSTPYPPKEKPCKKDCFALKVKNKLQKVRLHLGLYYHHDNQF